MFLKCKFCPNSSIYFNLFLSHFQYPIFVNSETCYQISYGATDQESKPGQDNGSLYCIFFTMAVDFKSLINNFITRQHSYTTAMFYFSASDPPAWLPAEHTTTLGLPLQLYLYSTHDKKKKSLKKHLSRQKSNL